MTLTVGSLFSGIGGFDLGLERAGMRVVWQAEVDPYCCRVLAKHWPNVPNLGDVTKIDWSEVGRVDVICGGYPCQPFSYAGARRGEHDERHLWPYIADAIRVLRPRFALMENVAGHLALGFGRVLGDLAEIGYDAEWDCIPAAAVGAPHRRDRVFIVAYPASAGLERAERSGLSRRTARVTVGPRDAAHADGESEHARPIDAEVEGTPQPVAHADSERRDGRPRIFGTRGRRELANSRQWLVEPDVGRVADGVPSRVDRLRGLGNAVVPQVAEYVGRRLLAHLERAA